MSKSILAYLFGDSQKESALEEARDHVFEILEATDAEEPVKTKKEPLVGALRSLGVPSGDLEMDPEGLSITFSDEVPYRKALNTLMEPEGLEQLAVKGWIAHKCGDSAMGNEAPEYRIRFIEISTAETTDADKASETIKSAIEKGREFATKEVDSSEDGNPVEHPKPGNKPRAGVGDAKDGADPDGKPKGSGKSESAGLVDHLLGEGGHKPGCTCGFCKNKGRGFKKKDAAADDSAEPAAPAAPKSDEVEHTFESEPPRYDDIEEALARKRGRPKTPTKDAPVAKKPPAAKKFGKSYKTPKK
jgi:hypothetical protein